MFRDPTIIDRSIYGLLSSSADQSSTAKSMTVSSMPLSDAASKSGLEDQTIPLIPNTQENPEFAKWWKRWASRVRRISIKKNPRLRRIKIGPPNSDPKAAPLISADCEFKRYL
jgi:hypothetical protein